MSNLRKLILKVSLAVVLIGSFVALPGGFAAPVHADQSVQVGICNFIGPICKAFGVEAGSSSTTIQTAAYNFVKSRGNLILSVIFIAIILVSVYIIIKAAVKYIRSEGEEKEIASSQKAIRSVFVGIGLLFVGVVGIVLVLAFFGGTGLLDSGTDTGGCTLNQQTGAFDCPTTTGK